MKIQYIAIIFIIILLPLILILSEFIQIQIDTISLQTQYDTKLYDATYDAVQAFQLNTVNNDFSTVSDSIRRDLEASINSFIISLANNLGVGGYTQKHLMPYIPAIAYTLYDGYYIYAPTENEAENNEIKHLLKPYIYYTVRYTKNNIDITVNYTLDNYIIVYGNIGSEYITKSGYLVIPEEVIIPGISDNELDSKSNKELNDILNNGQLNRVVYRDYEITDRDAQKYYIKAKKFSRWVNANLSNIQAQDARKKDNQKYKDNNGNYLFEGNINNILNINKNNDPEKEESSFVQHKREAIKNSIQESLNSVITFYNAHSSSLGTTYNFKMPLFNENEWDKVLSNVNMITFMQGLPVGLKKYNNYFIVTSTQNKEYIDPNLLYFYDENGIEPKSYHKIDCPYLTENNIQGYRSVDYNWYERENRITNDENKKIEKNDKLYPILGCYHCIINSTYDPQEINDIRKNAYYNAIGRARETFYKVNKYLNLN